MTREQLVLGGLVALAPAFLILNGNQLVCPLSDWFSKEPPTALELMLFQALSPGPPLVGRLR